MMRLIMCEGPNELEIMRIRNLKMSMEKEIAEIKPIQANR